MIAGDVGWFVMRVAIFDDIRETRHRKLRAVLCSQIVKEERVAGSQCFNLLLFRGVTESEK